MFTGIIETMGTVSAVVPNDTTETGGNGYSMTIADASIVLPDVHIGDSITVNGVCLTVTEFDDSRTWFKVGIAPETLRKTNLGDLQVGHKVNLERSMSASTRFGGHFVQGHVDTTVTVVAVLPDPPNSMIVRMRVPEPHADTGNAEFLQYIVPKGYITLDGTSLTVIDVDWDSREFSVMLIAHTQKSVVLALKKAGDRVNLEVDQVGKYVESMVRGMLLHEHGPLAPLIERAVAKHLQK
nr:Riboflavin synthase alpha chain [Polyrhizophydium stewartii]